MIGRSNTIGSCAIELGNGSKILVSNVGPSGLPDGSRDGTYRRFVEDFHRQLIAAKAVGSINFHSGFSQARMTGIMIILVIATGFFLLMPLVLLLITHDLKGLWILLVGAGLVFPLYRIAGANQPATYNPGEPPDLLP